MKGRVHVFTWVCGVCGATNSESHEAPASGPVVTRPATHLCYSCTALHVVQYDERRAVRVRTTEPAGVPTRDRRRDDVRRALRDAVDLADARDAWVDAPADDTTAYERYMTLRRTLQAAGRYHAAQAAVHAAWENLEAQLQAHRMIPDLP